MIHDPFSRILLPLCVLLFAVIGVNLTMKLPPPSTRSFTHSEARFCFSYPSTWSVTEFSQDGQGVILLDPVALREGVTVHSPEKLQNGAYVSLAGGQILDSQKDLDTLTPEKQLENSLAGGAFTLHARESIEVDGERGVFAEMEPRRKNGKVSGPYRLVGFVRHENKLYHFAGLFGTERASERYRSTFALMVRTFKFPEHCS